MKERIEFLWKDFVIGNEFSVEITRKPRVRKATHEPPWECIIQLEDGAFWEAHDQGLPVRLNQFVTGQGDTFEEATERAARAASGIFACILDRRLGRI